MLITNKFFNFLLISSFLPKILTVSHWSSSNFEQVSIMGRALGTRDCNFQILNPEIENLGLESLVRNDLQNIFTNILWGLRFLYWHYGKNQIMVNDWNIYNRSWCCNNNVRHYWIKCHRVRHTAIQEEIKSWFNGKEVEIIEIMYILKGIVC